jgi:beta-galactosidase
LSSPRTYSGRGVDQRFSLQADDNALYANGADTTRVVMKVTDEFGAVRPYANDPIVLELEGTAELIGDNPFALVVGTGAVWIRAKETPGDVTARARHPRLGNTEVRVVLNAALAEQV